MMPRARSKPTRIEQLLAFHRRDVVAEFLVDALLEGVVRILTDLAIGDTRFAPERLSQQLCNTRMLIKQNATLGGALHEPMVRCDQERGPKTGNLG